MGLLWSPLGSEIKWAGVLSFSLSPQDPAQGLSLSRCHRLTNKSKDDFLVSQEAPGGRQITGGQKGRSGMVDMGQVGMGDTCVRIGGPEPR